MKRVISMHLSGKIYQIEEDAYNCLTASLAKQWRRDELERQIASIFETKLNSRALLPGGSMVITYVDVLETLHSLGIQASAMQSPKRLCRVTSNKVLGGVCSGLGEYFAIDPVVFRVLFVVSILLATLGLWTYLILWIVVPEQNDAEYRI
ncbi:MAG: PspC domain-containing protein [Prevotellaceae bacterium]|jgi:phage shock protein C|nr:PspC domain-containing protein [Prevotellaceae bacterium]